MQNITPVPLTAFRVWDALNTNTPTSPGNDDLSIITGTFGTNAPYLGTGDSKAATVTRYAACMLIVPPGFEPGRALVLRLATGMLTTIADTSAVLDVEAWRLDGDGTLGSADLCATDEQDINSVTIADKSFAITTTTLRPGDILICRVKLAVVDGATATAVIAGVWLANLIANIRT